jgi:hypothetical protein
MVSRCEYCYVNGNTGEVKVADLGRAKFLFNDSQAAATIAGGNTKGNWVYNYTAPELYDGKPSLWLSTLAVVP